MLEEIVFDDRNFADYYDEAEPKVKVKSPSLYKGQVKERLRGVKEESGAVMPWRKTHQDVQFRKGEVTVWAGINGHRKSMVTSQIALSLCAQDEKVVVASMEMSPAATLERMARMAAGTAMPGEIFIDELFDSWLPGRMWMYDQQGNVNLRKLQAVVRYAIDKFQATHFVIDNLAKCVKSPDDYGGQKELVDGLTILARDHSVHIHLVHHIRKGENEDLPGKMDIKGAGEIADLVDNVVIVWRNKIREDLIKRQMTGEKLTATELQKIENGCDQILSVVKQRNGAAEPRIALWFDPESLQMTGKPGVKTDLMTNPRGY